MMLLAVPPVRGDQAVVPLIEHMVRAGQWWDITDELAGRVRELLDAHPRDAASLVRGWSVSGDLWLRRLVQLQVVQFQQLWRRFLLRRRVLVMTTTPATTRLPMPSGVGIGWRQEIAPLLAGMPDLRWVEVVAEERRERSERARCQ